MTCREASARLRSMLIIPLAGCVGAPLCDPPPEGGLVEGDSLSPGTYHLVLVRNGTPSDSARTEGRLVLVPQEAELQTVPGATGEPTPGARLPLRGTLELDLAPLGVETQGDPGSEDPAAPGVAVIVLPQPEPAAPPRILLRVGSDLNRRTGAPVDGAYLILRTGSIAGDAFFGEWESDGSRGRATGHFCALVDRG